MHVQANRTLLWSDEFNGPAGQVPDSTKWRYDTGGEGWGNQELEYYTESSTNAALDGNGNLVITARQENDNNYNCWYGRCQYTSARLLTAGKFSQKYGTIEARIKIPKGQGIWPAFWMLGDDISQVGWPQCGEIDIMENIGKEPRSIHGTLHGPGYSAADGLTSTYHLPNNQPFADDFHVYKVEWTSNAITFSVDDDQYIRRTPSDTPPGTKWVYDHNFFILLNVAVGGGWPGPPNSSTVFPQSMIVDYVRVYSTSDRKGSIRGVSDRCVDVFGTGSENGTLVQLRNCDGSSAQEWTILDDDSTIRLFGQCLEVWGNGTKNGTPVQLNNCDGSDAQKWMVSTAGNIVNRNKCLDTRQIDNVIILELWDCNGNENQKWMLP